MSDLGVIDVDCSQVTISASRWIRSKDELMALWDLKALRIGYISSTDLWPLSIKSDGN